MCPTSPTNPIRTPPTRDSCKPFSHVFVFRGLVIENHSSVIYLFTHSLNFSFSFRNENPGFKRIVEKLERSPVCQRLPLRSFLVLPFQRITRIKLLVQVCVSVYVCEYVGPLPNSKRLMVHNMFDPVPPFNTHTLFLSRTL